MPNMDKTGPSGEGQLTGRGMGNCSFSTGINSCRRGCGRGFGRGFNQIDLTKEEKQKILKAQKEQIEQELKNLE